MDKLKNLILERKQYYTAIIKNNIVLELHDTKNYKSFYGNIVYHEIMTRTGYDVKLVVKKFVKSTLTRYVICVEEDGKIVDIDGYLFEYALDPDNQEYDGIVFMASGIYKNLSYQDKQDEICNSMLKLVQNLTVYKTYWTLNSDVSYRRKLLKMHANYNRCDEAILETITHRGIEYTTFLVHDICGLLNLKCELVPNKDSMLIKFDHITYETFKFDPSIVEQFYKSYNEDSSKFWKDQPNWIKKKRTNLRKKLCAA